MKRGFFITDGSMQILTLTKVTLVKTKVKKATIGKTR